MTIVDMLSDLVIGLATFIFWRMFTAAPARHDVAAAGAMPPALAAADGSCNTPSRALPQLLDDICMATGLDGLEAFMAGAAALYEALPPAFAAGNIEAQRAFLSDEVYQSFRAAIAERNLIGEKAELMFIGIESARIADAALSEELGRISVAFVGLVVAATRNRGGEVIAGSPTAVVKTAETWTFEHELGSPGTNWILVATEPEA